MCMALFKDVEYSVKAGVQEQFRIEHVSVNNHRRVRREVSTPTPNEPVSTVQASTAAPGTSTAPPLPSSTPSSSTSAPSSSTPSSTPSAPSTSLKPQTTPPVVSTKSTPAPTTTPTPKVVNDTHSYYKSQILQDEINQHWIELPSTNQHKTLSKSHRTAVTINLNFPFQFYGHNITNVTVATGGFVYASPFLHQWLTATQYIAPLMANFDTRISNNSGVFYDNSVDRFVVQWKSVYLQNDSQPFDFEVVLTSNGTIKFLYKTIPVAVQTISSEKHPVKVGLSDAFYIDSFLREYGIRRRTIYEYHRVALSMNKIKSGTVVILDPLPTCNTISDCGECIVHQNVKFECSWCQKVQRCSDGIDWHRQTWLQKGCKDLDDTRKQCPATTEVPSTTHKQHQTSESVVPKTSTTRASDSLTTEIDNSSGTKTKKPTRQMLKDSGSDFPVAAVIAVLLIVILVVSLGGWLFYAYTHPHSASGMWLLENRPSRVKDKLSKMTFWKKSTPAGTQYQVESTA